MRNNKLDILFEDKHLIVVNKPSGLLTISTDNEKERTLFHEVYTFEKKKNKNNKVFIVHRLDKDTSGIVVFAKSEDVKLKLQNDWNNTKREYIAVVNGKVSDKKGTIRNYLFETKDLMVYSTSDPKRGKLAITDYEVLSGNSAYTMLRINILTGRKNQIRVHMYDIGHSIVGDKKYITKKRNPIGRLCLHANIIIFEHPITHEELILESRVPNEFYNLIKVSN